MLKTFRFFIVMFKVFQILWLSLSKLNEKQTMQELKAAVNAANLFIWKIMIMSYESHFFINLFSSRKKLKVFVKKK